MEAQYSYMETTVAELTITEFKQVIEDVIDKKLSEFKTRITDLNFAKILLRVLSLKEDSIAVKSNRFPQTKSTGNSDSNKNVFAGLS